MEEAQDSVVQNSISELWEYHHPSDFPKCNPETMFTSGFILTADVAKARATTIRKIAFIVDRAPWRVVLAWACWCVERALEREKSSERDPHVLAWEVVRRALRVAVGGFDAMPMAVVTKALANGDNLGHAETAAYQVGVAVEDARHGRWLSFRIVVRAAVREAAEIPRQDADWMVDADAREAEHVVQLTRLVEMVEVVNAAVL